MTVPTGAVMRASIRFQASQGEDIMNVFFLQTTFAAPQAELDVFNSVRTYFEASYGNLDNYMSNTGQPLDIKLDVVSFQAGKWVVTANVGFGTFGTGLILAEVADPLPVATAALLKLRTSLGKHYGRKFFGLFTELTNVSGFLSSALQLAVLAFGTGLLTPGTISAGNTYSVVVPDTLTGVVRALTEVAVNSVWSYQRRRRTGVGS